MMWSMTDLLTPTTDPAQPAGRDRRRSVVLTAAVAGSASCAVVLAVCMAVGLAGWFASDAGAHGDTRDAIRIGADAWLLAHGAPLALAEATISVVPLGLSLLCGYVTFRMGRWAGAGGSTDDRTLLVGAGVLAVTYGALAAVTATLASVEGARTSPGAAFLGGFLLALLSGGPGLVSGSGRGGPLRGRLPRFVVATAPAVAAGVLLMFAAGSAVLAVGLLLDLGPGANVLARLHTDVAGGLLYTLVVLAVVPNAALFGTAYLVGPGFVLGTGTVVSPSAVVLGPLPAFPLLAALPEARLPAAWAWGLAAVPVIVGAVAAALSSRRHPEVRYELGALRGAVAGVVAGAVLGGFTALAGGSVGPGRMADVGAFALDTMLLAGAAMGIGGVLAGLVATWWHRRRGQAETAPA